MFYNYVHSGKSVSLMCLTNLKKKISKHIDTSMSCSDAVMICWSLNSSIPDRYSSYVTVTAHLRCFSSQMYPPNQGLDRLPWTSLHCAKIPGCVWYCILTTCVMNFGSVCKLNMTRLLLSVFDIMTDGFNYVYIFWKHFDTWYIALHQCLIFIRVFRMALRYHIFPVIIDNVLIFLIWLELMWIQKNVFINP